MKMATSDSTLGATLACGHVARGLIARAGADALCFDCGSWQTVITQWVGAIPVCGTVDSHDAIGAPDGEDG